MKKKVEFYSKLVEHYNVYLDRDDLDKLVQLLGYLPKGYDTSNKFWDEEEMQIACNRILGNLQDQQGKWHEPAWYNSKEE